VAKPANQILYDEITRRSALLMRYNEGVRASVSMMLRTLKAGLVRDLKDIDATGGPSEFQRERMVALLKQANETIKSTYANINEFSITKMSDLAMNEAQFSKHVLDVAIPVEMNTVGVGEETLLALANNQSVLGVPLSDWWDKQSEVQQASFTSAMQGGMLRGETTGQLVSRVLAPEGEGGAGMDLRRSQAETLVRTGCSGVANEARETTWKENSDLIKAIMWVSTLDDRTSDECIARDGVQYDIDTLEPLNDGDPAWEEGPGDLHPNCRSTSVPVLLSAEEMGLEGVSPATRASMDGQVPETTTYGDWLKGQSEEVQNDALGVGKADLFREGRITSMRDLLDASGRPLTLDELTDRFPKLPPIPSR
jgi:SPP1 gp7 family putative phage head morphogenesis protein